MLHLFCVDHEVEAQYTARRIYHFRVKITFSMHQISKRSKGRSRIINNKLKMVKYTVDKVNDEILEMNSNISKSSLYTVLEMPGMPVTGGPSMTEAIFITGNPSIRIHLSLSYGHHINRWSSCNRYTWQLQD